MPAPSTASAFDPHGASVAAKVDRPPLEASPLPSGSPKEAIDPAIPAGPAKAAPFVTLQQTGVEGHESGSALESPQPFRERESTLPRRIAEPGLSTFVEEREKARPTPSHAREHVAAPGIEETLADRQRVITESRRTEAASPKDGQAASRFSSVPAAWLGGPGSRTKLSRGSAEDAVPFRAPGFRGGSGDPAAASVARSLLVDAAPRADRPAQNLAVIGGPSSEAAGVVHGAAGLDRSAAGTRTSTVAEILASGMAKSDSLADAARALGTARGAGRHQVIMQLDPPELGQMRLDIRMRHEAMALRVDVDDAGVARLIESRLPELKDALAAHGIRIDHSEIVVRSPSSPDGGQHSPDGHRTAADQGDRGTSGQFHGGHGGSSSHASGGGAKSDGGWWTRDSTEPVVAGMRMEAEDALTMTAESSVDVMA